MPTAVVSVSSPPQSTSQSSRITQVFAHPMAVSKTMINFPGAVHRRFEAAVFLGELLQLDVALEDIGKAEARMCMPTANAGSEYAPLDDQVGSGARLYHEMRQLKNLVGVERRPVDEWLELLGDDVCRCVRSVGWLAQGRCFRHESCTRKGTARVRSRNGDRILPLWHQRFPRQATVCRHY